MELSMHGNNRARTKRVRAVVEKRRNKAKKNLFLKRHPEIGFGFSIRGGKEHGTGIFVSSISKYSDAYSQGLKVGDQILQANKQIFRNTTHVQAVQYIQCHKELHLTVYSLGVIPGSKVAYTEYQWTDCYGTPCSPLKAPLHEGSSLDIRLPGNNIRKVNVVVGANIKLGLLIRGGLEYGLGIFVAGIDEDSVVDRCGIMVGEQIMEVNGINFTNISHADAAHIIRTSKMMTFILNDVSKIPVARIIYDQLHWVNGEEQAKVNKFHNARLAKSPVFKPSIVGRQLQHQAATGPSSYSWIEEKAQEYLNQEEWSTLRYYIKEYVQGNVTVNGLALSLIDLFDSNEKMDLMPEVRGIVRAQDIETFDAIVLGKQVQAIQIQNEPSILYRRRPNLRKNEGTLMNENLLEEVNEDDSEVIESAPKVERRKNEHVRFDYDNDAYERDFRDNSRLIDEREAINDSNSAFEVTVNTGILQESSRETSDEEQQSVRVPYDSHSRHVTRLPHQITAEEYHETYERNDEETIYRREVDDVKYEREADDVMYEREANDEMYERETDDAIYEKYEREVDDAIYDREADDVTSNHSAYASLLRERNVDEDVWSGSDNTVRDAESLSDENSTRRADFESDPLGYAFQYINSRENSESDRKLANDDSVDEESVVTVSSLELENENTSKPRKSILRQQSPRLTKYESLESTITPTLVEDAYAVGFYSKPPASSFSDFQPKYAMYEKKSELFVEAPSINISNEEDHAGGDVYERNYLNDSNTSNRPRDRSVSPSFDVASSLENRYAHFAVNDILRQDYLPTTTFSHSLDESFVEKAPLGRSTEGKKLSNSFKLNIQNQYQYQNSNKLQVSQETVKPRRDEYKAYGKPIMSKSPGNLSTNSFTNGHPPATLVVKSSAKFTPHIVPPSTAARANLRPKTSATNDDFDLRSTEFSPTITKSFVLPDNNISEKQRHAFNVGEDLLSTHKPPLKQEADDEFVTQSIISKIEAFSNMNLTGRMKKDNSETSPNMPGGKRLFKLPKDSRGTKTVLITNDNNEPGFLVDSRNGDKEIYVSKITNGSRTDITVGDVIIGLDDKPFKKGLKKGLVSLMIKNAFASSTPHVKLTLQTPTRIGT